MELAELELEVDPPRDLHRVAELFGLRAECLGHLFGRLDVKLVRIETPSRFIGERLAGLDAEQDFVGARVAAMQVVAIVGGDQRQAGGAADLAQRVVERRVQAVVLQFEVEAVLENARVALGRLARLVDAPRAQPSRDLSRQASRERDDALVKLGQNFLVDARLVVEPFLVGGAQQTAQVAIAGTRGGEQDQMEVAAAVEVIALGHLRAIGALAGRDVGLASDDRFDPVLGGFAEKLDRAKHVAMVGDGHRGHARGVGVLEQRLDLVGAVEEAVLGMDVEMGEAHQRSNLLLATTTAAAARPPPMAAASRRLARLAGWIPAASARPESIPRSSMRRYARLKRESASQRRLAPPARRVSPSCRRLFRRRLLWRRPCHLPWRPLPQRPPALPRLRRLRHPRPARPRPRRRPPLRRRSAAAR